MTTPPPGAEAASGAAAGRTVGYAVVGLGWIAQVAVLPAFANAGRNSRLAALVSGDAEKRRALAARYRLPDSAAYDYDGYEACLRRDDVDAVYLAVPNHLHREYAVRAAEQGVHVLCEKPMAVSSQDCRAMIDACDAHGVRLMVAYRLHFEPANLHAVAAVTGGRIGATRVFSATFTQQVQAGDVKLLPAEKGGGPLYDIGVYCINAARYLFRAEPESVWAARASRPEERFAEVEEAITCLLRFPDARLAAFTCSFGAHPVSVCHLVGDRGELAMENAFSFQGERRVTVTTEAGPESRTFPESDHFGPQLLYFSDCVLGDYAPEPDGEEGWVDVRVVEAVYESLETGRAVALDVSRARRPEPEQVLICPAVAEPAMVHAEEPSGG